MKEDYSKYVGQHVFVYNYDGMKDCRHVGKVVKLNQYGNPILKGVIKLSSNKLCFKEEDSLRIRSIKIIPSAEYMAILAAYKKHEQMRAKIKGIFKEYYENLP